MDLSLVCLSVVGDAMEINHFVLHPQLADNQCCTVKLCFNTFVKHSGAGSLNYLAMPLPLQLLMPLPLNMDL